MIMGSKAENNPAAVLSLIARRSVPPEAVYNETNPILRTNTTTAAAAGFNSELQCVAVRRYFHHA
jgi:hypothetical protein